MEGALVLLNSCHGTNVDADARSSRQSGNYLMTVEAFAETRSRKCRTRLDSWHNLVTCCCGHGLGLTNGTTTCGYLNFGGAASLELSTRACHRSRKMVPFNENPPLVATAKQSNSVFQRLLFSWAALKRNFKHLKAGHALYYVLTDDLRDVSPLGPIGPGNRSTGVSTRKVSSAGNITALLAVTIFSRLLECLKSNQNTRGILKIIRQVPRIIANLPPLALWPRSSQQSCPRGEASRKICRSHDLTNLATEFQPLGDVVESIISAAKAMISGGGHKISEKDEAEVLAALVGLAVKQGSLTNILQVLQLIFLTSSQENSTSLPGVVQHLETGEQATWILTDNEKMGRVDPCIPSVLHGVELAKVHSSAFLFTALTTDGELILWNRTPEQLSDDDRSIEVVAGSRVPLESISGSVSTWYRGMRCEEAYEFTRRQQTCSNSHRADSFKNAGVDLEKTPHESGSPVLQILGDKPAVADVTCGLDHTLVLLVTGELSPRLIEGLRSISIATMSGGWEHSLALTRCGKVFSFGGGHQDGRTVVTPPVLGISIADIADGEGAPRCHKHMLPMKICEGSLGDERVEAIACGWDHCMAITGSGLLFTWGAGSRGQLGHGDTELRRLPTLVEFFSIQDGGRVHSIAAGRHYSTALTSDGRLFAWGSRSEREHLLSSARGRDRGRTGTDGAVEGQQDAAGTAMATLPRVVDTANLFNSRPVRLAEGDGFDLVLVKQVPPIAAVSGEASCSLSSSSRSRDQETSNISDCPRQPVGRMETVLEILRHLERLGVPHGAADSVAEVDLSIRQALAVRRRWRRAVTRGVEASSSTIDGRSPLATVGNFGAVDPHATSRQEEAETFAVGAPTPREAQLGETSENPTRGDARCMCKARIPRIPFCVDPSQKAFQLFVDLVHNTLDNLDCIVEGARPEHASKLQDYESEHLNNDANGLSHYSSSTLSSSHAAQYGVCGGRISPGGSIAGLAAWDAQSKSHAIVTLEVLRRTLRLLAINLFHFVRAISVRRIYRDYDGHLLDCKANVTTEKQPAVPKEIDARRRSALEDVGPALPSVPRRSSGNLDEHELGVEAWCPESSCGNLSFSKHERYARSPDNMEGCHDETSPEVQGAIMNSLAGGRYDAHGSGGEGMGKVVSKLYAAIAKVLEMDSGDFFTSAKEAVEGVQAEAVGAFNIGFGLFFPSHATRVHLLRDAVGCADTRRDDCSGIDARPSENRHRVATRNRNGVRCTTLEPNLVTDSFLSLVVMEISARESVAAGLVIGALEDTPEEREPRDPWKEPVIDQEARHGIGDTIQEKSGSVDLDELMEALLSGCIHDLHKRLWGARDSSSTTRPGGVETRDAKSAPPELLGRARVRLLLALQTHAMTYWGDTCEPPRGRGDARNLCLAHTTRLIEASLDVFVRISGEGLEGHADAAGDKENRLVDHDRGSAMSHSFLALLPLLCASIIALPAGVVCRVSLAADLLPPVMSLARAVEHVHEAQISTQGRSHGKGVPLASIGGLPFSGWLADVEVALAALASDLVGNFMLEIGVGPRSPGDSSTSMLPESGERGDRTLHTTEDITACDAIDDDTKARDDARELLLSLSPFLRHARECFDDGCDSSFDNDDFADASKVIAWEEELTSEFSGPSSLDHIPWTEAQTTTLTTPTPPRSAGPRALMYHRRRRASCDRSEKLSPIGTASPLDGSTRQASLVLGPVKRCTDGSLGSDPVANRKKVLSAGERRLEPSESVKAASSSTRQLGRMVDETHVESFIQDLLCGRGTAQGMYHWMISPPESQQPVLHVASLATQGQGWGSYQSLSSNGGSFSGYSDDESATDSRRRRHPRALSTDVDAAVRALLGVIIQSNALSTEAATFAKCRLDRASSPPPALKRVAAAIVEVREALMGLVDSSRDSIKRCSYEEDHISSEESRGRESTACATATTDMPRVEAMFSEIVSKCRFLLKCPNLPSIILIRNQGQKQGQYRRERSSSHLSMEDQQIRRDMSAIFRRWARQTKTTLGGSNPSWGTPQDTPTYSRLSLIFDSMVHGCVRTAVSIGMVDEQSSAASDCASLESLAAFAASPVTLEELERRTAKHELIAKTRASSFRLFHYLLDNLRLPAARQHIASRLSQILKGTFDCTHTTCAKHSSPALLKGAEAASQASTGHLCSTFIQLCQYVVHQLRNEPSEVPRRNDCSRGSISLANLLSLLRFLMASFSPCLVDRMSEIDLAEQNSPRRASESNVALSKTFGERPLSVPGQSRSHRSGGGGAPPVTRVDPNRCPPLPGVEFPTPDVFATALPALGNILRNQGDLLSGSTCDFSADPGNVRIHYAAWEAACLISTHLCEASSTSPSMRMMEKNGSSARGISPGSGRVGSYSREHAKHGPSGRRQRWWSTVQMLLATLFGEFARVQKRLHSLEHARAADDRIVQRAKARTLVDSPISLPLSSASTTWEFYEEDERETRFGISFWVLLPEDTQTPQDSCTACAGEKGFQAGGGSPVHSTSTFVIFDRAIEAPAVDRLPNSWIHGLPRVALTRSPSDGEGSGSTTAEGGDFFVSFTVIRTMSVPRENSSTSSETGDGGQGTTNGVMPPEGVTGGTRGIGDASSRMSDPRSPEGHSASGETAGDGQELFTEGKLVSEARLPVGRWVSVCCSFSQTQVTVESPTDGGTINTSRCRESATIQVDGLVVARKEFLIPLGEKRQKEDENNFSGRSKLILGEKISGERGDSSWTGKYPVVCGIRWYRLGISEDEALTVARNSIPRRLEDELQVVDDYAVRLATLTRKIVLSSQRVVAVLSSPRWISLWLSILCVSRSRAQRAILRLLQPLLSVTKRSGSLDEIDGVLSKAIVTSGAHPGRCTSGDDTSDEAIVHQLCALIGRSLCSLRVAQFPDHADTSEDLLEGIIETPLASDCKAQCHPKAGRLSYSRCSEEQESCVISEGIKLLRGLMTDSPTRWQSHVSSAFKDGLAATAAGTRMLTPCTNSECQHGNLYEDKHEERSRGHGECPASIGAALAAVYITGGRIKESRIGEKVTLVPHLPGCSSADCTASASLSAYERLWAMDLGRCEVCAAKNLALRELSVTESKHEELLQHGTVVHWIDSKRGDNLPVPQRLDGKSRRYFKGDILLVALDEGHQDTLIQNFDSYPGSSIPHSCPNAPSAGASPRCLPCVVAVPTRFVLWDSDVVEPDASFLLDRQALAAMNSSLDSKSMRNDRASTSNVKVRHVRGNCPDAVSRDSVVLAHLRCRLVRALAAQLTRPHQALAAIRGEILTPLLTLATENLKSSVTTALGPEGAVCFTRRREFAPLVLSLDKERGARGSSRSLLSEFETACQVVWTRISHLHIDKDRGSRAVKTSSRAKNVDGDNHGADNSNVGVTNFLRQSRPVLRTIDGEAQVEGNRVRASSHFPTVHLPDIGADLRCGGGRWYYEVTLLTGGLMQLGWAGPQFQCSPVRGQGVGDHPDSWAFDGFRQKKWSVSSAPYGKRWQAGDVVGVFLDAGQREISFSLNGHDLGVAFSGFDPVGLYPAASLNVGQAAYFNFGYSELLAPASDSEPRMRPIGETFQMRFPGQESIPSIGLGCLGHEPHPKSAPAELMVARISDQGTSGIACSANPHGIGQCNDDFSSRHGVDESELHHFEGVGDGCGVIPRDDVSRDGVLEEKEPTGGHEGRLELKRQSLVENLMGLGFPIEWAIRAADRPGTADVYQDDTKESDDGDAYEGDGVDSGDGVQGEREYHDCLADQTWQDSCRRRFLARSSEEFPATMASFRSGRDVGGSAAYSIPNDNATAEHDAGNREVFSCHEGATAGAYEVGEATGEPGDSKTGVARGLVATAMFVDEALLPCLSLVLDAALSTLYARAAVVNLLSHVGVSPRPMRAPDPCSSSRFGMRWTECAWPWLSPWDSCCSFGDAYDLQKQLVRTTVSDVSNETAARALRAEIQGVLLEKLEGSDCQRHFVDLTKVLIARDSSMLLWRRGGGRDHLLPFMSSNLSPWRRYVSFGERNPILEDVSDDALFACDIGPVPLDLFPGICYMAMYNLLQLIVSPHEASLHQSSGNCAAPSGKKPGQEESTSVTRAKDIGARYTTLHPARTRFLKMIIDEAVLRFESVSCSGTAGQRTTKKQSPPGVGVARPTGPEASIQQANIAWATWVLGTTITLGAEGGKIRSLSHGLNSDQNSLVIGKAQTGKTDEGSSSDDTISPANALASAKSPRAFAAVLLSACSKNLDMTAHCTAYQLCAEMLRISGLDEELEDTVMETAPDTKTSTSRTAPKGGGDMSEDRSPQRDVYAFRMQEREVARSFAALLRTEDTTRSLSSAILRRKLEFLVQCQHRRMGTRVELEGFDWDVASAVVAGPSGRGDAVQSKRTLHTSATGSGRLISTGSETSGLSNSSSSSCPGGGIPDAFDHRLVVETVTATSVTLSWGTWSQEGTSYSERTNGMKRPGLPSRSSSCPGFEESKLARALRSKTTTAREYGREPTGITLKVAMASLWGAEPFKIVAENLPASGTFTLRGLAPDTRYCFRLEGRHAAAIAHASKTTNSSAKEDNTEPIHLASRGEIGGGSARKPSAVGAEGTDTASCESSATTDPERSHRGGTMMFTNSQGSTNLGMDGGRTQRQSSLSSSTSAVLRKTHNGGFSGGETNQTQPKDRETRKGDSPPGGRDAFRIADDPKAIFTANEWVLQDGQEAVTVDFLHVATPPELPFRLDIDGCGPHLRLSNSNLTVTNIGRKKWSAVRATIGFSSGVHRWKVHIDRCVSKNVFIGVLSAESRLNNYLGSDRSGWGYLANKAIWHNKAKVRSYGELFRHGDTIDVDLNMDLGTLRFARNGHDLGVAVQGLEGMLFPAFSMYNRGDQLTLIPPDASAAYTTSSYPAYDAEHFQSSSVPRNVGGKASGTSSTPPHCTFSAECVVRRAAKVLDVLQILSDDERSRNSVGVRLLQETLSDIERSCSRPCRISLPSSHVCSPVLLDASEKIRETFHGLGAGDRVLSAEGEGTILGATRHSLWVILEDNANFLAESHVEREKDSSVGDPGAVGDKPEQGQNTHGKRSLMDVTDGVVLSTRPALALRPKCNIVALSRREVRRITSQPGNFATTLIESSMDKTSENPTCVTSGGDDGGAGGEGGEGGEGTGCSEDGRETMERCESSVEADFCSNVANTVGAEPTLSGWTRAMDGELRRYLDHMTEYFGAIGLFHVPFGALDQLPDADQFPLICTVPPAALRARVALVLHVNELVLPLLPLVDTTIGGCGKLGALIRAQRHIILNKAKLSLLNEAIRGGAVAMSNPESPNDDAPVFTFITKNEASLPKTVDEVEACLLRAETGSSDRQFGNTCGCSYWAHEDLGDESIFGQLLHQLSGSPIPVSDGPRAFAVQLREISVPLHDIDAHLNRTLSSLTVYRGIFWKVCLEVCSSPISMFASRSALVAMNECATYGHATRVDDTSAASIVGEGKASSGEQERATTTTHPLDEGMVPNPSFVSSQRSRTKSLDPERVGLYRSLGFIVGLAVRTGVPLPLSGLTPRWWMLVAEDCRDAFGEDDYTCGARKTGDVANNEWKRNSTYEPAVARTTSVVDCSGPSPGNSVGIQPKRQPSAEVDWLLGVLRRLADDDSRRRPESDSPWNEVLADARFVGLLSNGQVVELFPGGKDRAVTVHNLSEYCSRLAWLRAAEYLPQASAFRAGLEEALPAQILSLLTWRELEGLICNGISSVENPPAKPT